MVDRVSSDATHCTVEDWLAGPNRFVRLQDTSASEFLLTFITPAARRESVQLYEWRTSHREIGVSRVARYLLSRGWVDSVAGWTQSLCAYTRVHFLRARLSHKNNNGERVRGLRAAGILATTYLNSSTSNR